MAKVTVTWTSKAPAGGVRTIGVYGLYFTLGEPVELEADDPRVADFRRSTHEFVVAEVPGS